MTRVAEFRPSEFMKIITTEDQIFHETILNI